MTLTMWFSLAAIAVLLVLSGFFSGTETAMTGVSRPRMHALAKDGKRSAGIVTVLLERKDDLIGSLLLANNLVNVLATSLATNVLVALFAEAGVAYATLIMSLLLIVFSEVLPKTYALYQADGWALRVAWLARALVGVATPIVRAISVLTRAMFRLFGPRGQAGGLAAGAEELRGAIDLHRGGDETVQHERAMLRSILDLDEVEVGEIVTHRKHVFALDGDLAMGEAVDRILDCPFTRVPVYRGDPDNIVGVVHAKDVLRRLRQGPDGLAERSLAEAMVAPWFIPENTRLFRQLQAFRKRREHFALVIDEYGTYLGIVTLEDILEEIVGEIDDEEDEPVGGVSVQADGACLADGTVTIRDLNRELEWALPDDSAATVAGLVMQEARRIPEAGETFDINGYRFEVLRQRDNQVTRVRIDPPAEAEASEG